MFVILEYLELYLYCILYFYIVCREIMQIGKKKRNKRQSCLSNVSIYISMDKMAYYKKNVADQSTFKLCKQYVFLYVAAIFKL
jgi:hypothetical protein